jgi:hypothetical protein
MPLTRIPAVNGRRALSWLLCTCLLCITFWLPTADAAPRVTPVSVQLNWKHQFEFAGY